MISEIAHVQLTSRHRRLLLAPLGASMLMAFAVYGSQLPSYNIVQLGECEGTGGLVALKINRWNQIAGYVYQPSERDGSATRQAFRMAGLKRTVLKPIPGFEQSVAMSINDSGVVAGFCYNEEIYSEKFPVTHACIWRDTTAVDLGTFNGFRSMALDINNRGEVAIVCGKHIDSTYVEQVVIARGGSSRTLQIPATWAKRMYDPSVYYNAYRYDQELRPDLFATKWSGVMALEINDLGALAGSMWSNQGDNHAFVWIDDAVTNFLTSDLLSGSPALVSISDMNDSMSAIGELAFMDNTRKVYLRKKGAFSYLTAPDHRYLHAQGINNEGVIAGFSWQNHGDDETARLWINGQIHWADNLASELGPWSLGIGAAINNLGCVVGAGKIDTVKYSVLLVPRKAMQLPVDAKLTVTLERAASRLVADVYLVSPFQQLLIANNLLDAEMTLDTIFKTGTNLVFGIWAHAKDGSYMHLSSSKFARVEQNGDTAWAGNFEDLPDSLADWDYNDVVIKVRMNKDATVALSGPTPRPVVLQKNFPGKIISISTARVSGKPNLLRYYNIAGRAIPNPGRLGRCVLVRRK